MAYILPSEPDFNNNAERLTYECLKKLPDDYVVYFNYVIDDRQFDFGIIVPGKGMVIIEVKGWKAERIDSVIDNNNVIYNIEADKLSIPSPLKQAQVYCFRLINYCKNEKDRNLLVLPLVCYPDITVDDYNSKRLDVISSRNRTLLKEDLTSPNLLLNKLNDLFIEFDLPSHGFDWEASCDIRLIFEPKESIEMHKQLMKNKEKRPVQFKRNYYSLLIYIPPDLCLEDAEALLEKTVKHWSNGTRIYIFTPSSDHLNMAQTFIYEMLNAKNLINQFEFLDDEGNYRYHTFNFSIFTSSCKSIDIILIVDGNNDMLNTYESYLDELDHSSNFNLVQYRIEHMAKETNIVVRAGAGTGKTISMISRINYLIYVERWTSADLKENLVLITFTNEATEQMKNKLREHFQNYFLLTGENEAFEMIECIEAMNISTIHSLTKKIIKQFVPILGLGNDMRIVSAKYERDNMISSALNNYLIERKNENESVMNNLGMPIYVLKKRLAQLHDKIESKNMDIVNDNLDFGKINKLPELGNLISEVPKTVEKNLRMWLDDNNSIRLSELMIRMKDLLFRKKPNLNKLQAKYVFIDEFQDTDDVQIELIKDFQAALGFNLFIVGDIKQCIYRFRGAEERAFEQLIEEPDSWGASFELTKNYRTDRLLLNEYEKIFSVWGQEKKLVYDQKENALISNIILNQDDDNYFVPIKTTKDEFEEDFMELLRKAEWFGTTAILVRENADIKYIRDLGLKTGIFIDTDIGGNLFQSKPAHDLLKLVLALQNPSSAKQLFNLYYSSYTKTVLPIDEICSLDGNNKLLTNLFYSKEPVKGFDKASNDLKDKPVLTVLRELIRIAAPWRNYADGIDTNNENKTRLAKWYRDNLDKVFESIVTIGNNDYITISRIEQYLRIAIFTNQSEDTREGVKCKPDELFLCTTVHKAKGLEFDTVILPFCDRDISGKRKQGYVDVLITKDGKVGYSILGDVGEKKPRWKNDHYEKEERLEHTYKLYEETRILYVALTRAKRRLIYFDYGEQAAKESWQSLIQRGGG